MLRTVKDFKGELKKNDHFFDKNPYKPKDRQGFFVQIGKKNEMLKPLTNDHFGLGPSMILKVFLKTVFLKHLTNDRFDLGPSRILKAFSKFIVV